MKSEGKSDDSEHINRTVRSRDTLKVEEVGWQGMTKWPLKIWRCKQTHSLVLMITLDCRSRCDRCRVDSMPGVVGGGVVLGSIVPYYTRIDAYYRSHESIKSRICGVWQRTRPNIRKDE
jgi:hypothetical protein